MRTRAFLVYGLVILVAACTGDVGPTGPMGVKGTDGLPGTDGPTGIQGTMGLPGVSNYEIVSRSVTLPAVNGGFGTVTTTADCPAGKMVLGGGINTGDDIRNIIAQDSYPNSSGTGWTLLITSGYVTQRTVVIYAICVIVT